MTRADAFINFAYAVSLLAPLLAFVSFRLRNKNTHRKLQLVLLITAWVAVLVLETRIRLQGGSGSFISAAQPHLQPWAKRLLLIHISVAIASYGLWTTLAVLSWRRYRLSLPGGFSRTHRRLGWLVFSGLTFDAASATGMYLLTFVA
ncbi:MAG: DUF420 domain-containing protein [Archangiaceae bacterium]|nr:DUF420 domain-containing protein [Archangiaceae bacterium]